MKNKILIYLAKLDCALDQSPTIVAGLETTKQLGKNRGKPNTSWALIKNKNQIEKYM